MTARDDGGQRVAISLAHEPAFRLGALQVYPGTRQVVRDGRSLTLEPRVMQVLVALSRANGQILSREDLIDLCWNSRSVGDNAIHRALSRVREISVGFAVGSFGIETISKVGYRLSGEYRPGETQDAEPIAVPLVPTAQPPAPAGDVDRQVSPPPATFVSTRAYRGAAVAVAVILLSLAAIVARPWAWASPRGSQIAIVAPDSGSERLAREITVDLAQLTGVRDSLLRVTDDRGEAAYTVQVAGARDGNIHRVDLSLVAAGAGEMLWSSSLERSEDDGSKDLRPEASAKLGQVLLCAFGDEDQRLSPDVLRLYLSACERMQAPPDQQLTTLLQRVIERAPKFTRARGELAMAQASQYQILRYTLGRDAPESRAAFASAQEQIRQARAIDPELPSAVVAQVALLEPSRYSDRLALLGQALLQNDRDPLLHAQYARALFAVGRLEEAVRAAERAASLNPLSPDAHATLVASLAHSGALNRAKRELLVAERRWPDSEQLLSTRFSLELRYGDPRIAQRMIDSGHASLGGSTGGFGGAEILMQARLDPSAENLRRMVRFASVETLRAPRAAPLRIQALGHAGAKDEFFGLLDQPGIVQHLRDATEVLFRPHLKIFRDDARFLGVAARLGLLQLWMTSRRWPDYCSDPRLPYDCRREGERILRRG